MIADFLHTEGNLARAQRIAPGNVGTWEWNHTGQNPERKRNQQIETENDAATVGRMGEP